MDTVTDAMLIVCGVVDVVDVWVCGVACRVYFSDLLLISSSLTILLRKARLSRLLPSLQAPAGKAKRETLSVFILKLDPGSHCCVFLCDLRYVIGLNTLKRTFMMMMQTVRFF
jgi:hypothetical protein